MKLFKYFILLVSFALTLYSCDNSQTDNSYYDSILKIGNNEPDFTKDAVSSRLLCYNVRHCEGIDNIINYDRITAVIDSLHPDVVCLQELDSVTTRSNQVNQVKTLGERSGMYNYFGSAIPFQSGKYGVGILSKEQAINIYHYSLPGTEERRTALIAEFSTYIVICVHLSLTESDRIASVDILTQLAKTFNKKIYLAGDFNEPNRYGLVFTEFLKNWNQVSSIRNTFPTTGTPTECIDYVLTYKSNIYTYETVKTNVVYNLPKINVANASDHFPIFVDFKK